MNNIIEKEKRIIISEDIRFGLFKNKLKKEYESLVKQFEKSTESKLSVNWFVELIKDIKELVEENCKGQYTDIFIEPTDYYSDDYIIKHFKITIGRYETDEEYHTRIEKYRKYRKEQEEKQLKREAQQLIKLQKKFKLSELSKKVKK